MYSSNTARYDNYGYEHYKSFYNATATPVKPVRKPKPMSKPSKKKKKSYLLRDLVALSLLAGIGSLLIPASCNGLNENFLNKPIPNTATSNNVGNSVFTPTGGLNYSELLNPTLSYTTNFTFLNDRISYPANETKKAMMSNIQYGTRLNNLEKQLIELNKKYPNVHPSVLVYSIENHDYVKLNSDRVLPSASIIKLPVLIQLYKSIEAEQLGLNDAMFLTEYYRSSGSGNMQYSQAGQKYSISDLAKMMIQDSDNTATNMLMSKVGSMNDINSALKNWGIKHTHVQTWLPDLTGTNYTTAEDMAKMLYNISDDNNSFLNVNSQADIINIMSNVKNTSLIKAGLPENTGFIHKTGDIGKMLGDAGIVYLPTNERYIVVIMVERPHNSYNAKLYIQEASKIIYNYMSSNSKKQAQLAGKLNPSSFSN